MKKAFLIVGVVAAYSALETVLLLSTFAPDPLARFPNPPQMILGLAMLLLIPGMAALMSRIMYGPYMWPRRTLMFMLLGASTVLIVPVGALFFAIPIAVLAWAYDVNLFLFAVLLPLVVGGMLWTFVFLARKSGKWSVRAEAERWLAERRSGVSQGDRRWRTRGIRIAVCMPTLITLAIFLFLPETWGLVTQLRWRQCGELLGYRVPLPESWIVFYRSVDPESGKSHVSGFIERGIARGGNPLRDDAVSWWAVDTKSRNGGDSTDYDRWPHNPNGILERRVIKIGRGDLECVDYLPSYPPVYSWELTRAKTTAYVDCAGVGRLHADFSGSRRNLDAFYRVLEGITETK